MSTALRVLPDGEIEAASAVALAEDETFAGPAPDEVVQPAASLLRFITCGSVDDGKSTLIGRLLHDTNSVFDDQMEALERDSRKFGTTGGDLDFALLVDGLSAEREQGITIDVAYRYFSTAGRAFIIADTPGHEQYTRNMATGASQAELAIILVDARKGILPQTRRHSFITSMVGIRSVIVAVNKMDLVDYDEAVFRRIETEYRALLPRLGFTDVAFVPISAKSGDNVANRSASMPWYDGPTLLERLETVRPETLEDTSAPFRMPVQWVNRPNLDFRGFCGTVASGRVAPGDAVVSLPSGRRSRVKAVFGADGEAPGAGTGEAVTLTLNDEIDASRGDVIVAVGDALKPSRQVAADILWMSERPLIEGRRLVAKLSSSQGPATVRRLSEAVDIHSYEPRATSALSMNEIGRVTLAFERPTVAAPYDSARELGAFILIDPTTNETAALGVVTSVEISSGEDSVEASAGTTYAAVPRGNVGERLRARWLGSAARRPEVARALVRFRAVSAVILGILAILFGMPILGAVVLAAIDFALRPFLWQVLSPMPPRRDATAGDAFGDGAGI
ncbi:sulfate adenylyltransferase subunit CysN [Aureimonas mangrovi]|uniref:sulfate adenylyltransferase subunit CysN n=1 Tax=Aureimonas mangrovi TaxID=2758041 RepID=UPI00163DAC5C|nr:sulfate adenylyltransferase subunit CysN [Aureimonas mangrovi]